MKYLHEDLEIVHGDLKPDNILITNIDQGDLEDFTIKLGDFGFSRKLEEEKSSKPTGTPAYFAPEIIKRDPLTKKIDCWAAGVIVFFMLTGHQPFENGVSNLQSLYENIQNKNFPDFNKLNNNSISSKAKDFVNKLIGPEAKDPEKRMTASDALGHPWFSTKNTQDLSNEDL